MNPDSDQLGDFVVYHDHDLRRGLNFQMSCTLAFSLQNDLDMSLGAPLWRIIRWPVDLPWYKGQGR